MICLSVACVQVIVVLLFGCLFRSSSAIFSDFHGSITAGRIPSCQRSRSVLGNNLLFVRGGDLGLVWEEKDDKTGKKAPPRPSPSSPRRTSPSSLSPKKSSSSSTGSLNSSIYFVIKNTFFSTANSDNNNNHNPPITTTTERPTRTKRLALWLMVWNSLALVDALMFTFRPSQNLDGYLLGEWGPHTLAMTRMLANCQLILIGMTSLIAWTADERTLKTAFKILILATLGAFRAIASGVKEGTIQAPWKTGYATALSLPPLLLLSYFAWIY